MNPLRSFFRPPAGASRRPLHSVCVYLAGLLLAIPAMQASGQALSVTNLPATDSNAALALANAIKGTGIQSFSNVTFTGVAGTSTVKGSGISSSAGTFSETDNLVGLPSGIVLSTGGIHNAKGGNTAGNITQTNGTGGDAHLAALIGVDVSTVYDKTVLEFDFVPTYPTIAFRYVFSSDEFNEYANSSANDVFGFFVNGTTPAHNIARIPGTSSPVSINTVNGGNPIGTNPKNARYFRNNSPQVINLEMDGLTVVLTAQATVTPGVVNHIKIAIADVIDASYDSNVFIEQGSFVSGNAPLAVNDAYKTPINTPLVVMDSGVLANDTDADNNLQNVQLITAPTKGTVVLNAAGGFTYTPNSNVTGADSFTYQALDSTDMQSNVATVSLTVGAANAVPTSATSTVTVNRDSSSALPLSGFIFNDVDSGNSLTGVKIVSMSFPSGASLKVANADVAPNQLVQAVVIKNGGLKFSAAPGQFGDDYATLVYQVSDGVSLSAEQTLIIDVTNLMAEITVSGNGTPIVNGDASPATGDFTNFGAVSTVNGTMNRVFTIGNTGTAALGVEYVTVTGAHQNDFQVTIQPATSVTPEGSTTFTVQFDPSANGTRSATLNFINSDGDMSPFSFAIQGTGYNPALVPTVSSVSPATGLTLGGTNVTITGTNFTGVSGVTFGGVSVTDFTVLSSTQILATTPASAAGLVDVAVSHPGGTVAGSGLYTYWVPSTLAFVPPLNIYEDSSVDLAETAVASSGLPVSFTVVSGDNAVLTGTVLTFTGPGSVVVKAAQAGDSTHAPAEDVLRTLEVRDVVIEDGVAESWRVINGGPESVLIRRNGSAKSIALELAGDNAVAIAATGSTTNGAGNTDLYTAKYDAENGADIWSVMHGGVAGKNDEGVSVAVDSAGNVIIAGTVTNTSNNTDIYIAKYASASGALLWEATYAGDGTTDYGNDGIGLYDSVNMVQKGRSNLQIGENDEVIVGGYIANSSKTSDVVVLKYDSSGERLWEATYNAAENKADFTNGLVVNSSGDIFVAGGSTGVTMDAITLKFSGEDGSLLWEARYDGGKPDEAVRIALDSVGNPIIGGYTQVTSYDFLTVRYDSATGGVLNTRILDGPMASSDAAWDMAIVDGDHIMLTGASYSAAGSFDGYTLRFQSPSLNAAMPVKWGTPFSNAANKQDQMVAMDKDMYGNVVVAGYGQNSDGSYDAYTAKYRALDGAVIWQTKLDGVGGNNDFPRAVAMDPAGNAFVAGYSTDTSGSTDFWVSRYVPTLGEDVTSQVITFTTPPPQTYGTNLVMRASASSGLPVTYRVVSGPAAVSGNVLTFSAVGSVTVEATQDGDGAYVPALPVLRTFDVAKGRPLISFAMPATANALAVLPLTAYSSNSTGAAVTYDLISGPGQISGGNLVFTGSGPVVISASQAGDSLNEAPPTVVRTINVTRVPQNLTFAPPLTPLRTDTVNLAASAHSSSGLPVAFTLTSGPGQLEGDVLSFTNMGNVYVVAHQEGNAIYLPATSLSRSIRVLNVRPVLNPIVLNEAMVSMTVSTSISGTQTPTRYTATGLPPGIRINATTGVLSGKLTTAKLDAEGNVVPYAVTFTAVNSAGTSDPVTAEWLVQPIANTAIGTYHGLVDGSAEMSYDSTQTLLGLGGRITLTTTAKGSFTGILALETKSHAFRGNLEVALDDGPSATITISRGAGIPSLTLEFGINRLSGELTGSLSDSSTSASVAVSAWPNPWKAVGNPAEDYVGTYTAALERQPGIEDPAIPEGNGFGRLNVTAAGTATWTGKLADGTSTTIASALGPQGQLPLFLRLYTTLNTTAGCVRGWSQIHSGNRHVDGELVWIKPAQTVASRIYKDGIPTHILTVIGGAYTAPASGSLILDLPAGAANVNLRFSGGGMESSAFGVVNQVMTLSTTNAGTLPAGQTNPGSVTLTVTPSTGSITGRIILKDNDPTDMVAPIAVLSRMALYNGMVVPRLNRAVGHFLLGGLPTTSPKVTTLTTSPQLSGQVVLEGTSPP